MNNSIYMIIGVLIPLVGTSLGAAMVFLMRSKLNANVEKLLLGFASGIMVAASIWSLIMPSVDMAVGYGKFAFIPAVVGTILGVALLLVIDIYLPNFYDSGIQKGIAKSRKTNMLFFSVTIHNIPEGMAVGVALAGALQGNAGLTMLAALILSIGISIQNFPEGAIISMPLCSEGYSRSKSFWIGVLSGVVEPIASIITLLLTALVTPILPYLLAFAAGAMLYVVMVELIPEAQSGKRSCLPIVGFTIGFIIMMTLDIALS